MRIEWIRIHGFGCLVDREYHFPANKAVLVLEDNESGKSTLAAAILAGLCGFPRRKMAGELVKLKDIYTPWMAENYALEMGIEAAGKHYHIERNFEKDLFIIRDAETNKDLSAGFDIDLASHFLNLPREDFLRLAIISGKDAHDLGSTNIRERLSALVEGSRDEAGGAAAIAGLQGARYILNGSSLKIDSAIKRLSADAKTTQEALNSLDLALNAAGEDAAKLNDARNRQNELSLSLVDLDNKFLAARLQEVREQISTAEAGCADVESLRQEVSQLDKYASFPTERSAQLSKAAARVGEREAAIHQLRKDVAVLENEADALRARLDSAPMGAAPDEDAPAALRSCEDALKSALDACAGKEAEIEFEKRALAAEGVEVEVLDAETAFARLLEPDKEFLRFYRENSLQTTAQREAADKRYKESADRLLSIKRKRRSAKLMGRFITVVGGLFGMAFVFGLVLHKVEIETSAVGVLVGVIIAATGLVHSAKANGLDADEKARLEQEIEIEQADILQTDQALLSQSERLVQVAESVGIGDDVIIVMAFKEYERTLGKSNSLNSLQAQLVQLEESLANAQARAMSLLRRLGVDCSSEDVLNDELVRTRVKVTQYLSDRNRLREIISKISELERDIQQKQKVLQEELDIAKSILCDAGIDPEVPMDEAVRAFGEMEKLYRRYREIKDALLPAATKRVSSDEVITKLKAEAASLESQLSSSPQASFDVDQLASEAERSTFATASSSELEGARTAIRLEVESNNRLVTELEKKVGGCVDEYRRRYPVLQEELTRLKRACENAERFEKAVKTAERVMREVCEQSHRRWATALNTQAANILPHINSDYDTILFDEDLSFTARHASDNRILSKTDVDACLSTGAKDQIYLAVRLACCRELSQLGESLPIILDDPFIATDDERFRAGFEYLVNQLPLCNQVLILSCHKSRHEHLLAVTNVAERVAVIEL